MKMWMRTALLVTVCGIFHSVNAQCDLKGSTENVDFPDIEAEGVESYQMTVEYTLPGASQTDYYTEYYDILERRGRVDSIIAGQKSHYIYRTDSGEAWDIKDNDCKLGNVSDVPSFYKEMQNEWTYTNSTKPERKTMGPSAMFKVALDVWNTNRNGKMTYMGKSATVRGLNAQYWRRCDTPSTYVDYYFTTPNVENAYGLDFLKIIPLRVYFGGTREGVDKGLSEEQFEIISFQPFISPDVQPFVLPKGRGCKRANVQDPPDRPDFSNKNIMFSAEVIYRVIDRSEEDVNVWSYYSTLTMALDITSQHLAYYYTPWDTKNADEELEVKAPVHVIFDMKHGYAYQFDDETGNCSITREKSFVPKFELPKNGGSVSLTDPAILFPNNELYYMTKGKNRGLDVNIFEETVENYVLDKKNGDPEQIKKAIITHSYLVDTEVERNKDSVKNALAQIQMIFRGREGKNVEVLTFNFFGFSTQIRARRRVFNIQRCYRNDDEYVWVTLGFNADKDVLQNIKEDGPSIRSNILNALSLQSEVNAVRVPIILVDMDEGLYITLLILGKPPVLLDYIEAEDDKVITGTQEVEGVTTEEACATNCLEKEANCWGFSMCGAVCTYGSGSSATVSPRKGCKLYRRYDNKTFIPSMELLMDNIKNLVQEHLLKLMLKGKDDKMIQVEASSFEVTYPGEDDSMFYRIGNELNPRMRVLKAGAKLKTSSGNVVKNLGKLRYDECQRVCLDFKDCETVSYCLKTSECIVSKKYGDDVKPEDMEDDTFCNLLTRKYADNFDRSPGIVLSLTAKKEIKAPTLEECARACITETGFKCLSFDHCPQGDDKNCRLHTVHYPSPKTRESVQEKKPICGHYTRKFSTEFKKNPEKRYVGAKLPPLTNVTLEECAKSCVDYGKGTCYGFDFCQDRTILATSCTLLDSDPSRMKSSYSPVCTNFLRTEPQFAPRPYSTGYAGGIAFLCLLVGIIVGVVCVFGIAYMRVNRR